MIEDDVYFQLHTDDGAIYMKGRPAPYGTITTEAGASISVVVESLDDDGDWLVITLSGGYTLCLHERRVTKLITRK
ncbi:hypothetical protein ACJ6WD_40530 [Streptomyces sp. VTCC 41912]|uniref:hypothetical protein n=1 Tax=Streptomyces sp. VTCC 41912 TaxID=3383243 RepID=UPI003896AF1F